MDDADRESTLLADRLDSMLTELRRVPLPYVDDGGEGEIPVPVEPAHADVWLEEQGLDG